MIDIRALKQVITPLTRRLQRLETQEFPDAPAPPPAITVSSYIAYGTADLAPLGLGSFNDVVGATLSLPAGTYLIHGVFCFDAGAGSNGGPGYCTGRLTVAAAIRSQHAHGILTGSAGRITCTQTWREVLAATTTVKLDATFAAGVRNDASLIGVHTSIAAIGVLA